MTEQETTGPKNVWDRINSLLTEVACTGWNDSTMDVNQELIDSVTDQICKEIFSRGNV